MNDAALQMAPDQAVSLSHMPFTFDRGIAHRAAIGLIVLATDQTIEHEFRQMLAIDGVAFYETRIHNAAEINPETLAVSVHSEARRAGYHDLDGLTLRIATELRPSRDALELRWRWFEEERQN